VGVRAGIKKPTHRVRPLLTQMLFRSERKRRRERREGERPIWRRRRRRRRRRNYWN
jgi:hypothetical protein